MPRWEIREAQVDYRLFDTPFRYVSAYGPAMSLDLVYQTYRGGVYYHLNDSNPMFGLSWHCAWSSELVVNHPYNGHWNYLGGRAFYTLPVDSLISTPAYIDGSRMEVVLDGGGAVLGGRVHTSDGRIFEYLRLYTNYPAGRFLLTRLTDQHGQSLTFSYDTYGRINQITNATGQTASLTYGNLDEDAQEENNRMVTQITGPDGYVATFGYEYLDYGYPAGNWHLTSITDTEGIVSYFTNSTSHSTYPAVESLVTPYGTTRLEYLSDPRVLTETNGPALLITEPGGGQHLYVHRDLGLPPIPPTFDAAVIPTGLPLSTLDTNRQERNTFYWSPRQLAAIGNVAYTNWTWTEFKRARIRHWLGHLDFWNNHRHFSDTLSWEQAPSPDGTNEGQVTWYDYAGKDSYSPELIGTNRFPAVTARKLPDGTTWYEYSEHNAVGKPTLTASTYTKADGSVGTRTNFYTYASNGIDLLTVTNVSGVREHAYGYNTNHQVLAETNAIGEYTLSTYDTNGRPTSTSLPTDLVTTNIYGTDGRLAKTIDVQISRTNFYTWTNGNVRTHTNELGLGRTFTYDTLARLTRIDYPDSTYEEFRYTKEGTTNGTKWLDMTYQRDRMGYVTSHTYNGLRQQTSTTDQRGNVTTNVYCTCGALESTTDALTNTTSYVYDQQGRLTATLYADGYKVTNHYNLRGQITNVVDSSGSRTTNWYNNQGLLVAVSNSFGRVQTIGYDVEDQATNVVDANGVTITNAYDNLGRLIARGYPDGGVERFGYSARGLIAYTNQLATNVTWYAYDEAGRKIAETNANNELTQFKYDASGNLTNLIDGRTNNTFWKYDQYGRVTNKMDHLGSNIFTYKYNANGWLTNRWTPAKLDTFYAYDEAGNLTNVNYYTSTDISLQYDKLNRVTNIVDAAGTTRYSYDSAGLLLSEDGPWDSDTVTYSYANRLRSGLNLQQPNASTWSHTYVYDSARRLQTLTSPAGAFSYEYKAGHASLPAKVSLPNGSYITNAYDANARLLSTILKNSTNGELNSHSYVYNLGNQRTSAARANGITNAYVYDSVGQLTEALCSSRPHERFTYRYDSAGNLTNRSGGINPNQSLAVDNLNQLTTANRSSTGPVVGNTTTPATNVTVNGVGATLHSDDTFYRGGISLVDGTNTFTAVAEDSSGRRDTNVVTAYLPVTVSFTYDLNGNLVYDGRKAFEYDDENQLTAVTLTNAWRSEFTYDGKMRRRVRKEFIWQSSSWVLSNEVRYVYDGNLVIQERDGLNLPQVSYTRGNDLSGTLEGAGGIGGLLARTDQATIRPSSALCHTDGNGNVTMLINTQQLAVAKYLYDPFGNVISMRGPLAEANLYRVSTKEWHANSGLVYYLYRYYEPVLQRWLNRDPVEEEGGVNLYAFVDNNPVDGHDPFGLQKVKPCRAKWMADCNKKCVKQGKIMISCVEAGFVIRIRGVPVPIWWPNCVCGDPKKLPACYAPE